MNPKVDEAFLHFTELIEELSDIDGLVREPGEETHIAMEIEEVEMELPIQLDIVIDERGKVLLGSVPPLYNVSTSFNPVFHQLSLKLKRHL